MPTPVLANYTSHLYMPNSHIHLMLISKGKCSYFLAQFQGPVLTFCPTPSPTTKMHLLLTPNYKYALSLPCNCFHIYIIE